jgi:hypothetical protein
MRGVTRGSGQPGSRSPGARMSAEKVPQSSGRRRLCTALSARTRAAAPFSPAVRSMRWPANLLPTHRQSTRAGESAERNAAGDSGAEAGGHGTQGADGHGADGARGHGADGQICTDTSVSAIRARNTRTSEVRREVMGRAVRQAGHSRGKTRGAMCPNRPPRKTLRVKGLGDKLGYPRATFVPPLIFLQHP